MANPFTRVQSFMSEVGVELKKSAWPTKKELVDSTIVVIVAVILLGCYVAGADLIFVNILTAVMGSK
jgi:preprotein translocase subunit SecE